jgi:ribosome-associated heat shock protein Hsp15
VGVLATAHKRGPAAVARALYDDRTPPPPPRDEEFAVRPRGAGRPVKRERRRLLRLRGR